MNAVLVTILYVKAAQKNKSTLSVSSMSSVSSMTSVARVSIASSLSIVSSMSSIYSLLNVSSSMSLLSVSKLSRAIQALFYDSYGIGNFTTNLAESCRSICNGRNKLFEYRVAHGRVVVLMLDSDATWKQLGDQKHGRKLWEYHHPRCSKLLR